MNTGKNTNTQTARETKKASASLTSKTKLDVSPVVATDVLSPGAEFIATYSPRKQTLGAGQSTDWVKIGPVVREAVLPLSHLSPATIQPMMSSLTLLCVWALGEGVELSVASVLAHSSIENFTARAGQAASSYRSMLRRVAKANGVATPAINGKLPRRSRKAAYTRAEIDCIRSYAISHTSEHRRRVLSAILFLSGGCGLVGNELRRACPADVHLHDDVLVLRAGSRCVPVIDVLADGFAEFYKGFDPSSKVPFIGNKKTKNVTDMATVWVKDASGLPPFSASSLRSFFAVEHLLRGTGTIELLTLLDVKAVEALEAYIAQVPRVAVVCPAAPGKKRARKSGGRS